MSKETASDHAKELSKLGASKGGKSRAERLTPEERSEGARRAALARWEKIADGPGSLPRATYRGTLKIGDAEIPCNVLEDGRRVLLQSGMLSALRLSRGRGTAGRAGDRLTKFVGGKALEPFIPNGLAAGITLPVLFQTVSGSVAFGYEATILADICEAVLSARDAGALQKQQQHIAEQCAILMRGFARVGIIALVDEATGYQADRARDELSRILAAYISPELMPWTKMFPDEFFKQIYRLQGWEYRPGSAKRTPYVGHLINHYIYDQLPKGVLAKLRELNPVVNHGRRRHKHFQFLTEDTGNPHLDKQIATVTMLMRISESEKEFDRLFAKAFAGAYQPSFPEVDEVDPKKK